MVLPTLRAGRGVITKSLLCLLSLCCISGQFGNFPSLLYPADAFMTCMMFRKMPGKDKTAESLEFYVARLQEELLPFRGWRGRRWVLKGRKCHTAHSYADVTIGLLEHTTVFKVLEES